MARWGGLQLSGVRLVPGLPELVLVPSVMIYQWISACDEAER